MPAEVSITRISPMLAVRNMEETIAFYQTVLGFTTMMSSPDYSIVVRDKQSIHLQKAASEHVLNCVRGHTEIYLEITGIRSLWEHARAFQHRYKTRDLFDREYGMTEFHIEDPNGCLVFVGEQSSVMKASESGVD